MAAASGYISGSKRTLYVKNDFATDNPTWAQLTAAASGIILAANLVKGVQSVGPVGKEGTETEFSQWGSTTRVTEAGVATRQPVEVVVRLDHSDTTHKAMRDLAIDANFRIAIVATSGSSAKTATYLKGTVNATSLQPASAGDDSWDDLTVTMTLSQDPVFVDQA